MTAKVAVSVDLRDSTEQPSAFVVGHRSVKNGAVHVRLVLSVDVDVLLDVEQAEAAMMRLASAVALARQPKRVREKAQDA